MIMSCSAVFGKSSSSRIMGRDSKARRREGGHEEGDKPQLIRQSGCQGVERLTKTAASRDTGQQQQQALEERDACREF